VTVRALVKIDNVDRKMLKLLSQDSEIPQIDLAKRIGISQPAVSSRINKLKKTGALTYLTGVDVKKAQLFLARIDVVTNDVDHLLASLDHCPCYLNSFLTSGRHNLTILLIGENVRSLISCVDSHIRSNPLVREMEFNVILTPIRSFVVPVEFHPDKKQSTPCGKDCASCNLYVDNRCLGCPTSINYKGTLL
jgi:Lrp/AsnC family leucine-responsive transcriptional regulator